MYTYGFPCMYTQSPLGCTPMTAFGVHLTRPWVYAPYALGHTPLARSTKHQAPHTAHHAPSTWRHVLGVLGVLSVLARPPENGNPCGRPVNRRRPGTNGAGRRQARHMAASPHKRSCQDAQDTQDPQECAREAPSTNHHAPCTNHHVPRANSSTNHPHHAPRATHHAPRANSSTNHHAPRTNVPRNLFTIHYHLFVKSGAALAREPLPNRTAPPLVIRTVFPVL